MKVSQFARGIDAVSWPEPLNRDGMAWGDVIPYTPTIDTCLPRNEIRGEGAPQLHGNERLAEWKMRAPACWAHNACVILVRWAIIWKCFLWNLQGSGRMLCVSRKIILYILYYEYLNFYFRMLVVPSINCKSLGYNSYQRTSVTRLGIV